MSLIKIVGRTVNCPIYINLKSVTYARVGRSAILNKPYIEMNFGSTSFIKVFKYEDAYDVIAEFFEKRTDLLYQTKK
jgi:hypothetical protein